MKPMPMIGQLPLSEFTLVYPSRLAYAAKEAAYILRDAALTHLEVALNITNDSIPHIHGILIGHTIHTPDAPLPHHEFSFSITEKGDLQILYGSLTALYRAVQLLIDRHIAGEEPIAFFKGDDREALAPLKDASLYAPGALRICYHNIFGGVSPDKGKTQTAPILRHAISARLYAEYQMDIVCLQEYNMQTRYEFYSKDRILAEGYREVPGEVLPRKESQTPIFYRPDRLELLKWGNHSYFLNDPEYDNFRKNGYGKMATWGVFRHLASNRLFAVCNTHFDHKQEAEANLHRAKEAAVLVELTKQEILVGPYAHIPLILGGDLNSSYNGEENKYDHVGPLHVLLDAGLMDVQQSLDCADTISSWDGYSVFDPEKQYFTCLGKGRGDRNDSIDHCMIRGHIRATALDILNNDASRRTSDHNPVVVDLEFC